MMALLASESFVGLRTFTADEVISRYVFTFYAAYIVAFLLTPLMRMVAIHYDIIDKPDGTRKVHTAPVAYLGGVAVFMGWLAGLTISQFLLLHHIEPDTELPKNLVVNFGIVVGACVIVLLGIWDDVMGLNPWRKIAGQVFAAVCLLATGVGRTAAWVFLKYILMRTSLWLGWPDPQATAVLQEHWIVEVFSILFVIGIVVVCCNAANLMDGLDGLCGGVTAIVAAGFLFLAVNLATSSGGVNVNLDATRVVLGLALLGAVLAFVPFNFNPASIFMGDTGSMFLGFCCATMMILFASDPVHFKWFLASMVMFALPLLDTALAFVRRWVNRRPLFGADRHHFHHQLVARGFTVKQTVLISYGLALACALLGAAIVFIRTRYAVGIYLVVFGSVIVAVYKMGMVHERVQSVPRQPLGAAAAQAAGDVAPAGALEITEVRQVGQARGQ